MLIIDPGGYSPFGPVKWLVVSALITGAAAFGLSGKVVVHARAIQLWGLFLAWASLSAVLGVDRFHAWLGTPTRRFGVLTWVLCALGFLLGHQVVLKRQADLIHKAFTVAGLGLGLYALAEAMGIAPIDLQQFSSRLGSTYGSPAYLGAISALLFPLLVGVTTAFEHRWRTAGWLASVLVLFGAMASGTRAAWVGLAVAGALVAVVARQLLALRPNRLLGALLLVVVVFLASPVGTRTRDAFDFAEGISVSRIDEWTVGLDTLAKRPFSGAGPEGYRIVFAESVSEEYSQTYGRKVAVDRAHNGLIDIAVTTGIPGLLLMVALLAILGRAVMTAFRSRDPVLVGTAAALVSYFVQQQFLFPVAEIEPLAWLLAGMLVVRVAQSNEFATWHPSPRSVRVLAGSVSVVAIVLGGLDVAANRSAGAALESAARSEFSRASELADRAANMRGDSITYASVGAEVNRLANTPATIEAALEHNARGLKISPRDPGLLAGRGSLLLTKARLDGSEESAHEAIGHWEALAIGDPNNGVFQLQLGAAYANAQIWVLAEAAWLRSSYLSPTEIEPHLNLGTLYLVTNELDKARDHLAIAESIEPDNPMVTLLREEISEQS